MSNRLQIKPLIENYMECLEDSEHTISQITGHVTIKNEDEYISKTKELQVSIIDDKLLKEDLQNKVNVDKKLHTDIENRLESLDKKIDDIESLMNTLVNTLDEYDVKVKQLDEDLINIDSYINDEFIYKIQEFYNSGMVGNLTNLALLLINAENLDVIIENQTYFENVLSKVFNYITVDDIVKNYETVTLHNSNMNLIDTLVDRTTYDTYVTDLINRYNALKNKYNLSGEYKISGAV